MDKTLIIEPTEIQSYYTCERMWNYSYMQRLRPNKPAIKLHTGILLHEGMQAYYEGDDPLKVMKNKYLEEDERIRSLVVLSQEEEIAYRESYNLIVSLMETYMDWAGEEDLKDWEEVVATEQSVKIDITDALSSHSSGAWALDHLHDTEGVDSIAIGMRMDMLVRDKWDKLWVVDHKTCASFPNPFLSRMDVQMGVYLWAVNAVYQEQHVAGGIFNYIRKANPARARSPLFKRSHTHRGGKEILSIESNILNTVINMLADRNNLDPIPMPGMHCSWRCGYTTLCEAQLEQNEESELREELFHVSKRINWLSKEED